MFFNLQKKKNSPCKIIVKSVVSLSLKTHHFCEYNGIGLTQTLHVAKMVTRRSSTGRKHCLCVTYQSKSVYAIHTHTKQSDLINYKAINKEEVIQSFILCKIHRVNVRDSAVCQQRLSSE